LKKRLNIESRRKEMLTAITLACMLAGKVVTGLNCTEKGKRPLKHVDPGNYAIDLFTGELPFTFAIGKCTTTGFASDFYYKYECSQNHDMTWTLSKKQFIDPMCTKGETVDETFTPQTTMPGLPGYYVCDGFSNYAKVQISLSPDCAGSQTVFAGLGGCAQGFGSLIEFYCDNKEAIVQIYSNFTITTEMPEPSSSMIESSSSTMFEFNNSIESSSTMIESSSSSYYPSSTPPPPPMMCNPLAYCSKWSFTTTACKLLSSVKGKTIYGTMDSCYYAPSPGGDTLTTTSINNAEGKKGASSVFALTHLLLAFVVAFFSLL
jgi:hypothetical protein